MGWQDLGRESLDMLRERLKRSYPSYHPTTQAIVAVAEKKRKQTKKRGRCREVAVRRGRLYCNLIYTGGSWQVVNFVR